MSIALMNRAFYTPLSTSLKFVLLAICDNANDEGECFPSVEKISVKTSLTTRAVRKCLVQLKQQGYLSVIPRRGRSNIYKISMPEPLNHVQTGTTFSTEPRSKTPEPCSEGTEPHSGGAEPRSGITITKPLLNHQVTVNKEEKSNDFPADQLNQDQNQEQKQKKKKKKEPVFIDPPTWVPESEWRDFFAMRNEIKKPMTEQAQYRMFNKLASFRSKGVDIAAALDASIRNNWSDVYEPRQERKTKYEETKEWLAQITGKTNKKEEHYVIDI